MGPVVKKEGKRNRAKIDKFTSAAAVPYYKLTLKLKIRKN